MRILHYFLGFPPYRSGGLTKYATDLMEAQLTDGHIVSALWPGKMTWINQTPSIKKRDDVEGIKNYELINPLPISLDEGIVAIDDFMKPCDADVYRAFLQQIKPEVIHVHTLMGLYREFIDAAKDLHIRTVFTTHDYFGICPKVTLYQRGKVCDNDNGCEDCIQCNRDALSLNKIRIMQSPIYRNLKNSAVVKQLRKRHREEFFGNEALPEIPAVDVDIVSDKYRKLRKYYIDILERMDLIHFNSSVTEMIYKRYFVPRNSQVMTITHKDIADNRFVNEWKPEDKLRITYLAPAKPFKGFDVLKTALDELWDEKKRDFELKVFSAVKNPSPYMIVQEEGFSHDQLKSIFLNTDVLVAPSVWYETFGFTVLEAISYGVPVIVSEHAGVCDVVGNGGIVIQADSVKEIKRAVLEMTEEQQQILRDNIKRDIKIKTWREFIDENYKLYEGGL